MLIIQILEMGCVGTLLFLQFFYKSKAYFKEIKRQWLQDTQWDWELTVRPDFSTLSSSRLLLLTEQIPQRCSSPGSLWSSYLVHEQHCPVSGLRLYQPILDKDLKTIPVGMEKRGRFSHLQRLLRSWANMWPPLCVRCGLLSEGE